MSKFTSFLRYRSCDIAYDILRYIEKIILIRLWYQVLMILLVISRYFQMIMPLISVTYDLYAVWYHTSHDILAHIMALGRRHGDGAGWGRHAPAAPPPPASPSPTYWGRVFSWTATDLIQLLSNCLLYTQAYSHWHSRSLCPGSQADSDSVSLSPSRWLEAGLPWPPSSWRPLCTSRGVTPVHER